MTEENEKLLEEKRELLRKISEAEEMGSKGMRTASTAQHRYFFIRCTCELLPYTAIFPSGKLFDLILNLCMYSVSHRCH